MYCIVKSLNRAQKCDRKLLESQLAYTVACMSVSFVCVRSSSGYFYVEPECAVRGNMLPLIYRSSREMPMVILFIHPLLLYGFNKLLASNLLPPSILIYLLLPIMYFSLSVILSTTKIYLDLLPFSITFLLFPAI